MKSQCDVCRYKDYSLTTGAQICLKAWDGNDEVRTCEAVEWIMMELAEAHSCPSFAAKGSTPIDESPIAELVVA